ncbi:hypothetical protein HanIR_Chr04g0173531 [Helianthus annuus]|nr:hypothetical protein HanIR_Chr04g0173531 [Helianthus annuus]
MNKSPWYVAIRKKRSPMGCKATGMCEKVQEDSNLANLLPGFGCKTQSPLWAAPASSVWARYTQIDLSLMSLDPNNED